MCVYDFEFCVLFLRGERPSKYKPPRNFIALGAEEMKVVDWVFDAKTDLPDRSYACQLAKFAHDLEVGAFLIQIGRDFSLVGPVIEHLTRLGFTVSTQKHTRRCSPGELAFVHITALRALRFEVCGREVDYLNVNATPYSRDEEWERCVFTVVAVDRRSCKTLRFVNARSGMPCTGWRVADHDFQPSGSKSLAQEWLIFNPLRTACLANAYVNWPWCLLPLVDLVVPKLLALLHVPDLCDEAYWNAVELIFRLDSVPGLVALFDLDVPDASRLEDACFEVIANRVRVLSERTLHRLLDVFSEPEVRPQCKRNVMFALLASLVEPKAEMATVLGDRTDFIAIISQNFKVGDDGLAFRVLAYFARHLPWRSVFRLGDQFEQLVYALVKFLRQCPDTPAFTSRLTLALADIIDRCLSHVPGFPDRFVKSCGPDHLRDGLVVLSSSSLKGYEPALMNLMWTMNRCKEQYFFEPELFLPLLASSDVKVRRTALVQTRASTIRAKGENTAWKFGPAWSLNFLALLNVWTLDRHEPWYSRFPVEPALRFCSRNPKCAAALVKTKFFDLL